MDPTGFNSWAGRGVASSILPSVKENPFAARMKMLETKVAYMEGLEARVVDQEARIAVLEQRTSFENQNIKNPPAFIQVSSHLVGLSFSLGLCILLLK